MGKQAQEIKYGELSLANTSSKYVDAGRRRAEQGRSIAVQFLRNSVSRLTATRQPCSWSLTALCSLATFDAGFDSPEFYKVVLYLA